MPSTATHLLRIAACVAGTIAALGLVLVAAVGSGVLAITLALSGSLAPVARRARGRVAVPRARSVPRAKIAG
jgi:hypothetical protein